MGMGDGKRTVPRKNHGGLSPGLAAVAVLLTASLAASQQPRAQTPVFRGGTELVLVNVVARDKSGALVRGLTKDDFLVLEDGKPQSIERAEFEQLDRSPAEQSEAVPVERSETPPAAQGAAAPGASEASASSAARSAAPQKASGVSFHDRRLVVLFFDLSSMQPEEVTRAVSAARTYVSQLTASDLVSVVSLSATWRVLQDFIADRESLDRVINRLDPNAGLGFDEGSTGDADGTADNGAAFTPDETEVNIFNTDRRLEALRALADALGGIDERKSVVYFSSGMSQTGLENRVQIRAVIDHAVRANVAIYAADARGLQAMVPGGEAQIASVRGNQAFTGQSMSNQYDRMAGSQDTLTTLSEDTGGRAFLDSNDLGRVFKRVVEDTSVYYVLGYSSTNTLKDGKYRHITVQVKRPGVSLEYRAGYYAPRDFAHSKREDREQQLMDALQADLSPTDLHVYVAAAYLRKADTRFYVPVSVVVPGSDVPFSRAATEDRATLDVLGVVLDEARRPVGRIRDTVKLRLEGTSEGRRKTIQYQTAFELPPGTYRLRVAVRENEGGAIGTFESLLTVPDVRRDTLKMSAVIVGTQVQPDTRRDSPLVQDGMLLVPNATHVVSRTQHLYFHYEVYDPAPQAAAAGGSGIRLLTSLVFFRNGVRVYETPLNESSALTDPARRAAVFRFDVPASALKPGRYTCQVNVVDDVAGTFAFPRLTLYVAP
jgi:VWFA-related protein